MTKLCSVLCLAAQLVTASSSAADRSSSSQVASDFSLIDGKGRDVVADFRLTTTTDVLHLKFKSHGQAFDYRLRRRTVEQPVVTIAGVDGTTRRGTSQVFHLFGSSDHSASLSVVGAAFHGAVRVGDEFLDFRAESGSNDLLVSNEPAPGVAASPYSNKTRTRSRTTPLATPAVAPKEEGTELVRRLRFAPDEVDRWTPCYSDDHVPRAFKFGALVGSKLYQDRLSSSEAQTMEWLQSMVNQANMIYTPQLNVVLQLGHILIVESESGAPEWNQGQSCRWSIEDQLLKLQEWEPPNKNMGVWHIFDDCFPGSGTIGLAYKGTICSVEKTWSQGYVNTGVNWYSSGRTWVTFAHEMGHNFGAEHSFENGQGTTGGIMDYGDGLYQGIYQFNQVYRKTQVCSAINSVVNTCNAFSSFSAQCGNQLVEDGEQCECSSGSKDCTFCCNCQIDSGKQCSPEAANNQCCTSTGMFADGNAMCTSAGTPGFCSQGSCFTEVTCTAYRMEFCGLHSDNECKTKCIYNGQCSTLNNVRDSQSGAPINNVPNGVSCDNGQGSCQSGSCIPTGVGAVIAPTYPPQPSYPNTTTVLVSGCDGYADRGFLGTPDIRLSPYTNFTREQCNQACIDSPTCHSWIYGWNNSDLCELWTSIKRFEHLAVMPGYDTYICPHRALNEFFPDADLWPNWCTAWGSHTPRLAVSGGSTRRNCYDLCTEDPGCHMFQFSANGSCFLWGVEKSARDTYLSSTEVCDSYIFPCRGKGKVCSCHRSDEYVLHMRCRCAASSNKNECSAGNYCWKDGTCSDAAKPTRRLNTCVVTADPTSSPTFSPTMPPADATQPPTSRPTGRPTASPTAACDSFDNGAKDSYRDACSAYQGSEGWCGDYDDDDFSSVSMCCACGGGSLGPKQIGGGDGSGGGGTGGDGTGGDGTGGEGTGGSSTSFFQEGVLGVSRGSRVVGLSVLKLVLAMSLALSFLAM